MASPLQGAGQQAVRAPVSASQHPFKGRTVAVVNDLSRKEQWYLYCKTRELKEAISRGQELNDFRLRDPQAAVYTIFMEDSTRTKESFRNAAEFHGMKVNVFDSKTSSFQKNETITDTVKMLAGYSIGQSIFVIRSKIEGVCRWLEEAIDEYTTQRGYPRASFINAGDGRHEHPTQEMLDEFSFLEHKGWDSTSIHLALLGDLYHGRTVHSKVDGLKIYGEVDVDLIAPPDLALPEMYEDRMISAGFRVRKFKSIEEYLAQPKVAKIWYFTRLQLERMGDKVRDRSADLRKAVTMQREFVELLPAGTKFFHPLPRDARYPTIPFWIDGTSLNGWDQQSQNGYFTRIVLLGMLGGKFGHDLETVVQQLEWKRETTPCLPNSPNTPVDQGLLAQAMALASDFVKEVKAEDTDSVVLGGTAGLAPVIDGVVIDRIAENQEPEKIWSVMFMVRSVLGLNSMGGMGVYRTGEKKDKAAGFLTAPDFNIDQLTWLPLKKLAAMSPGSTLSILKAGRIHKKFTLQVPPKIYNFPDISCKNEACISHPDNMQREVSAYFHRLNYEVPVEANTTASWAFTCKYCETVHTFWQIWDHKYYQSLSEYSGV
mmetsp:Transcript_59604/g.129023  ORF Transcript_59604/g.129023 Transcript_59604/m.129023 type:complete len:599 (+) Transcript_59604:61-1857(+)